MLEEIKLQHYGVKGMKWGVRKEYEPVGRKTKSNVTEVDSREMNSLELSLALLGVGLIISNVGNKKVTLQAEDPALQLNSLKSAKRIKPPESYLDSVRGTNNTKSVNKNFKNNCPNTTLAYELRRRGYDVKAKPAPKGLTMSTIRDLYNIKESDLKINNMSNMLKAKENSNKIIKYFDSQPDGYRGAIGIHWDGLSMSGHIFNVERINGRTIFIDSQSGKSGEFKGTSFMKKVASDVAGYSTYGLLRDKNPANYLNSAASVEIFRTDNAVINEANIKDRILKG